MNHPEERPKIFGTGLIALDLVIGLDSEAPVHSWAGGTCGNVLTIMRYLGWDAYPIARMNGDPASERVRADMAKWGVKLDFANCAPTGHTPIIIQQIKRARDGSPTHRFLWTCPHCGKRLPSYRPVTQHAVEDITLALPGSAVFFMDRLSRAALTLAAEAAQNGAVVLFEPWRHDRLNCHFARDSDAWLARSAVQTPSRRANFRLEHLPRVPCAKPRGHVRLRRLVHGWHSGLRRQTGVVGTQENGRSRFVEGTSLWPSSCRLELRL